MLKKKPKDQANRIISFVQLKSFITHSNLFYRESHRRGNILQLSVDEVLQNIEHKIAYDLDEIC